MTQPREPSQPKLKAGVVGAGRRFLTLLRMLGSEELSWLNVEVVAVADSNPKAVGLRRVKERGIKITNDYRELFDVDGLEIIIELTGNQRLLHKLITEKPDHIRILDHTTTAALHDIIKFGRRIEQAEEEISLNRSFAEALGEDMDEAFLVLDPDYRVVRANAKALEMAGLSKEEAVGRYCFQISHQAITPCDGPTTPCPLKETLATGKAANCVHEHVGLDGHSHYCTISTHPLLNAKGEVVQILEIFRSAAPDLKDRMERRARAVKGDISQQVKEDKFISLGKLVASVAHEINNPLASIYNFAKLILTSIREGRPSDDDLALFERYLDLTVREAKRCSKIVNNLLAFAREKGMEAKEIDLVELLDSMIVLTQHKMELSGIELRTDVAEAPLNVYGDPTQIQQCLTNLIFNALEAMEDGGRLTISAGREDGSGKVWISVADTGVGIAAEDLEHIFEPFFSTKTGAPGASGVGLGLSMVKSIIEDHGGEIVVDSRPGRGSTFTIILPPAPGPGGEA